MQWLLLLGVATGMRTMTPIAVLCWFAYLRLTPLHGWAFWAAYLVSALVFTVLALGEYIGDTLPSTPNRTAPGPAAARLVFGGVVGALAVNAISQPAAGGVILGVMGAAIGTWGGYRARAWLAKRLGHDLPAALLESAAALLIAYWSMHRVAINVLTTALWWARQHG